MIRNIVWLPLVLIIAASLANTINVGSVHKPPITVYVYDEETKTPLSGVIVYHILHIGRDPHILGIPTMQSPTFTDYVQRAYTDSNGNATFTIKQIPLRIREIQCAETILINMDRMAMNEMDDIIGWGEYYMPKDAYNGLKVTLSIRNKQHEQAWELMDDNEYADVRLLKVALSKRDSNPFIK